MSRQRPKVTVHDAPDAGPTVCRVCHHPIEHFADVGWVDLIAPGRGGLYDFCTAADGTHVPEKAQTSHPNA